MQRSFFDRTFAVPVRPDKARVFREPATLLVAVVFSVVPTKGKLPSPEPVTPKNRSRCNRPLAKVGAESELVEQRGPSPYSRTFARGP